MNVSLKYLTLMCMSFFVGSFAAEPIPKKMVHYLQNLQVPLEELLKQEPYVLVELFAPWCGPCRNMSSVLATIAENNPGLLVIKVDIEQFNEIREQYNVKSIPTLLLFKNSAKFAQEVGFMSEEAIQILLEKNL